MRMDNRSLRLEIEDQMKLHGYSLNKVAELTGINAGNLSMVLNGHDNRSVGCTSGSFWEAPRMAVRAVHGRMHFGQ